jgi:hypothetical protein
MRVTVPTAASLDRTALAFLRIHVAKIAGIADDLRRRQHSEPELRDLVVRLGLHAAGAQAELASLEAGPP